MTTTLPAPTNSSDAGAPELASAIMATKITVPKHVASALADWERWGGRPQPWPQTDVPALREALAAVARRALADGAETTEAVDFTALDQAIDQAERASREAAISHYLRQAAGVQLASACKHQGQLLSAARARHAELLAELASIAERVPADIDADRAAASEQARADYMVAVALHTEWRNLHHLAELIGDPVPRGASYDGLSYFRYVRTMAVHDARLIRATDGQTTLGHRDSLEFLLNLITHHRGDMWLSDLADQARARDEAMVVLEAGSRQQLPTGGELNRVAAAERTARQLDGAGQVIRVP